jgi:saccharopine dehydrogenase (NAD+, L-glutamate forming)
LPGGFWTPATAFGDRIIARLQQHAGVSFDVLDQ